jgi:hypothetical protein
VTGINDSGRIVGYSAEALGFYIGFVDIGGSFSTIDDPKSSSGQTFALGINDTGEIVGYYNDSSGSHGSDRALCWNRASTAEKSGLLSFLLWNRINP